MRVQDVNENPILIIGISRSGTTLLSRMLNAHPKIKTPYLRSNFFRRLSGTYDPLNEENLVKLLKDEKKRYDAYGIKVMTDTEISLIKNYVMQKGLTYKNI